MPYSMQLTEQILSDPPQMGAKSTTTSNHPSTFQNVLHNFSERLGQCDDIVLWDIL